MSSTPKTRAITTNHTPSNNPSSPIPPPSQSYHLLIKSILRHRLIYSIFPYSALFPFLLSLLWASWLQGQRGVLGVLYNLGSPSVWVFGVAGWVVGVLPVVVLRKVYLLTAKPTTSPSPSKTFQNALSKPSTLRALVVYVTSAVLVTFLHVFMAYAYVDPSAGDPKLSVFVRSRKHPYYLNGRFLFVLIAQVTLACTFLLRNIMLDRFAFRPPPPIDPTNPTNSTPQTKHPLPLLLQTILPPTLLTTLTYPLPFLLFFLLRTLFLPLLFRVPGFGTLLGVFVGHFVAGGSGSGRGGGGGWTLWLVVRHWDLVLRTWWIGVGMVVGWEWAEGVFDFVVGLPITISNRTSNPALTLTSGITPSPKSPSPSDSTSDYYLYFAYTELLHIATSDTPGAAASRAVLFGASGAGAGKNGGGGGLWSCLVREGLVFLGRDYQVLIGRGKIAPPPPAPGPSKTPGPPAPIKPPTSPHTPLIKKPIFKSSQPPTPLSSSSSSSFSPLTAILDSFASDSKLSQAVEVSAMEAARVPELFRSVGGGVRVPPNTPVKTGTGGTGTGAGAGGKELSMSVLNGLVDHATKKGGEVVSGYISSVPLPASMEIVREAGGKGVRVFRDVIGWTGEWWRAERLGRVVEGCLPKRELDVLVIGVLTHLTCASLTEDRFGAVQRDIPRILEALLSFLSAVEEYQDEIKAKYGVPVGDGADAGMEARVLIEIEVVKAGETLGDIAGALKDGIARIVRTFGDKLLAFKFPPRTARKLQGFIDYN